MLKEFRAFILRGNLVDLAVAVVVGAAFTAVVNSIVKGLFTPLIAAIFGKTDFSTLYFTVNGSRFYYGAVINALITFVIVSAVLFFLVIKPVNHLMKRFGMTKEEEPMRDCPECLSKVPEAATKCAYCTSVLTPAGSAAS